jgi:hypothetical protein
MSLENLPAALPAPRQLAIRLWYIGGITLLPGGWLKVPGRRDLIAGPRSDVPFQSRILPSLHLLLSSVGHVSCDTSW